MEFFGRTNATTIHVGGETREIYEKEIPAGCPAWARRRIEQHRREVRAGRITVRRERRAVDVLAPDGSSLTKVPQYARDAVAKIIAEAKQRTAARTTARHRRLLQIALS